MEQVEVDWSDELVEQAVLRATGTTSGICYVHHSRRFALWTDDLGEWHVNNFALNSDGTASLVPENQNELVKVEA